MNGKAMIEPPKTCMEQIAPLLKEVRSALAAARALRNPTDAERESVEADICLTSRSAYFDFYTWLVHHGEVDPVAEAELGGLFQEALGIMKHPGFRDSVDARHREFLQVCNRAKSGRFSSELVSSA
jgi:hypothetical protein